MHKLATPLPDDPLRVQGWALFLRGTVSRVDVSVDGRVVGQARIGLPRRDLRARAMLGWNPAASVCGFEWMPDPADLPSDRGSVRVAARVTSTDGDTFVLRPAGELELPAPEPPYDDADGYAERLRRRTRGIAPPPCTRREPGLRLMAFTHRLDHGGAQRYFFEQIRYLLLDPDVSCTVVALRDGIWRPRLESIGADVHLTACPVTGVGEYEGAVAQLSAWAAPGDFNAVFVNTLDAFMGADLAGRLDLPVAWAIHESFPLPVWWVVAQGIERHPYVRERVQQALGQAAALIFAADATKRLYGPYAEPGRMVTAPYGVELGDIDAFKRSFDPSIAQRQRSAFPQDAVLLLCLGMLIPRKAQAVLAQAFGEVAGDHPNAHLLLVGDQAGAYSAAIHDYVADAGLGRRCTLLPATSDAYAWHEVADVFVLSSDVESSPISILEAMAFETPVVASRVFGVPELIEDGRHGYLCEPNDVVDLARCLDRVLSATPAERQSVAREGAARVRSRHDPERYARGFRRLLEQMVQERGVLPSWEAPSRG